MIRVAISGSAVASRCVRFKAVTASIVRRWHRGEIPAGVLRFRIGSPPPRSGTPW